MCTIWYNKPLFSDILRALRTSRKISVPHFLYSSKKCYRIEPVMMYPMIYYTRTLKKVSTGETERTQEGEYKKCFNKAHKKYLKKT